MVTEEQSETPAEEPKKNRWRDVPRGRNAEPTGEPEFSQITTAHPHPVRKAGSGKTINAGNGIRIVYRTEPFRHFAVLPMGAMIPIESIGYAMPASAPGQSRGRTR